MLQLQSRRRNSEQVWKSLETRPKLWRNLLFFPPSHLWAGLLLCLHLGQKQQRLRPVSFYCQFMPNPPKDNRNKGVTLTRCQEEKTQEVSQLKCQCTRISHVVVALTGNELLALLKLSFIAGFGRVCWSLLGSSHPVHPQRPDPCHTSSPSPAICPDALSLLSTLTTLSCLLQGKRIIILYLYRTCCKSTSLD